MSVPIRFPAITFESDGVVGVEVTLRNEAGEIGTLTVCASSVPEAVRAGEEHVCALTGHDGWTMDDWRAS